MAKKKSKTASPARGRAAKKGKAAKTPARWTSGRGAERAAETKKKTAAPKQPALIKGLRIRALDKVFEQIADTRGAMNRLRGEEADLERQAHRLMREHKQATWSWAGVEAARIPGEEKLRIRTSREASTAENDDQAGGEAEPEGESSTDTDTSDTGTGAPEGPSATDVDDVDGQVH